MKTFKRGAIKAVARHLAGQRCDELEPGDVYGIDGYMKNGDPAHFIWRQYTHTAKGILKKIEPYIN